MKYFSASNSEHHKALGDIANMNRFDNLALNVQKDLDFVKIAHRKGLRLPKFHIEPKTFNIVMCNTDLPETEIEITVVRGISYNVLKPRDVDTYVKVEFPYPQVSNAEIVICSLAITLGRLPRRKHRIGIKHK